MPTDLNTKPGSSTRRQRQTLVIEGKRHGLELSEIRRAVGGSISKLSAARASAFIKRFTGRDLPNEPGQKRSVYAESKKTPGIIRMITPEHVEQIVRLMLWYFNGNDDAAYGWLKKHWKVDTVSQLGSAAKAGVVIHRLKNMVKRHEDQFAS